MAIFALDCQYFNTTYLQYKDAKGNVPFNNILNSIYNLLNGDLSGLSSTLSRYKQKIGSYKANTSTEVWDKIGESPNAIKLTFPDMFGTNMTASLSWFIARPRDYFEIEPIHPNIITITDKQGNIVSDTIPNHIFLSIGGGMSGKNLYASMEIEMQGNNALLIDAIIKLDEFNVNARYSRSNEPENANVSCSKNGHLLATYTSKAQGTNMLKSFIDPATYPMSVKKRSSTMDIFDKLVVEIEENSALLKQKEKELATAGYKIGSKEYAEGLANAKNASRNSIIYNSSDNIFLGTLTLETYYDKENNNYMYQPYLTTHNKEKKSMAKYDNEGTGLFLLEGLSAIYAYLNEMLGI